MVENQGDSQEQTHSHRLRAIGSHIRAKRREQNLTQGELASRANMSRPQLSDVERNGKNMYLSTLFRIAEVLDVHPADLMDDRGW